MTLKKSGDYISVPGPWRNKKKEEIKNFGYSSYFIKVNDIKEGTKLALTTTQISTNFNIFIVSKNFILNLGGLGQVASSKSKSIPKTGNFINDFVVKEKTIFDFNSRLKFSPPRWGPSTQ